MEAIVLAGGFGTRLREVVPDLPKPMAPVAGRPFLEILLASLARKRFTRVVLSLGYMADKIIDHFGHRYLDMDLVYEVEDTPLGTGGAIRAALNRCVDDHAFVFNGDTYLELESDELERRWQATKQAIIVVREVDDTARFGKVELRDGRITAFLEKGEAGPGLINAGCYVLPKNALEDFPAGEPFSLENRFFVPNLQTVHFNGFITRGLFIDIGVPADYHLAQTLLADL
jgi:D-glycero-alpha-D-manno-heptose 1-phosphate guanylyltransferase